MADFGIQVIGDSGYFQIDSTTVNLVYIGSGTLTLTTSTTSTATLTVVAETPLMVINSPDGWAGVINCVQSGNSFTYTFAGSSATGGDFNFRWFLFDRQPNVSLSGYGLAVWNEAGRLVYSSAYRPLRILGLIDMVVGTTQGGGVAMPIGSYGAVPIQPAYGAGPGPGGGAGSRFLNSAVRTQSNLISYHGAQFSVGTNVPSGGTTKFLVVDLTGYI
ncbi:hypothetical protein [Burkholderia gladioli]|uniref:hypothetical protein n=1 Tax=Burkholderia gladioli TaxID=28095 RepID=UPI0016401EE0|nr:hypothetical protein [Burkholderia gladioli]